MFARLRVLVRPLVAVALLAGAVAAGHGAEPAAAQPGSLVQVGSQRVTSSTWNYDGTVQGYSSWTSMTVTNLSCERNNGLPIPGTAQAGAVVYQANLSVLPGPLGATVYEGTLTPVTGTMSSGHVRVSLPVTLNPITQVDATIWGIEEYNFNILLSVCMLPGS
jgi:hypothetical protein